MLTAIGTAMLMIFACMVLYDMLALDDTASDNYKAVGGFLLLAGFGLVTLSYAIDFFAWVWGASL